MKKYIINLIPFILGIGCLGSFSFIGSKVLEDGTLSEPFFLILTAYLLFFIGIIGLIVRFIFDFIKDKKVKTKNL
ncbi:lipoprotein [[Clostridium] sordellii]|uniref:DUF3955 domain-containing protein n=1 Tax=Paraclostridium sordellii TaxID=1505 RepID=UPI0002F925A5|nr:DUF3955 domain-containing protein [Paeniclostridium sordellii]TAN67343.1 DUF3955 domain-containing protein [Paeniclostridium sordellii 8483]CEK30662.1 lipoprotein [[Clostridium] sordellii] [Paeniclostridium sordellii]